MPSMSKEESLNNSMNSLNLDNFAKKPKADWIPPDYKSVVDESILNVTFQPDIFQKQAFYCLSKGNSIFVSAHTSSGKTLVAEYAIALSLKNNSRVIYTSPIKALSNQKFYDFKQKFPDIGIITGDVQVNPNAKCLIMTTEILRNLVYKNSDILRDTEFVVFDEVHYINDPDRGVVWEECIIMLPKHINLVMLSATIPNAMEFAEWVGRTKNQCIYVISTSKRAVPLEFAIYCDSEAFSIEDKKPNDPTESNFKVPLVPISKKTKISNRNKINDLGNFVNNRRLVPAIFFTFSKKNCEEHGRSLQLLDLTTPNEKKIITKFLDDAMSNLREEDRNLPQVRAMKDQAYCGIATHHGALLPFVKECVEILFSENLIKILVATETFAMGVNMPAKCCAFLNLSKIDNGSFRYLHTGEFIQMSGRAGRRGMDKVGTVLIADPKISTVTEIKKVISGMPRDLNSQFKLSFSLILMAFRSNVEVKDLMRKSFREHDSQKSFHADMIRLSKLESMQLLKCDFCQDYIQFLNDLDFICTGMPIFIKRSMKPGTVLVLKNNSIVKVEAVFQSQFSFKYIDNYIEGPFFQKSVEEINFEIKHHNLRNFFQYPITLKSIQSDGQTSQCNFEQPVLMIKDNKISFDFEESEIYYVCKLMELKETYNQLCKHNCLQCPQFLKHYFEGIESKKILDQISAIKAKYSAEGLAQMKEYSARLKFLSKYLLLDQQITLKGRVAAEIRTVNDVLVTELIFNNELEEFTISEILAIFSTMISEEEEYENEITEELQEKLEVLKKYFSLMSEDLESLNIPPFDPLNFGMVQAVYDWCSGHSLGTIVAKYKVQEGSFVRLLLRLDECSREMTVVSEMIGNNELVKKFSSATSLIKRDIVFVQSLYI